MRCQLVVAYVYRLVHRLQRACQFLGHVNRTVLAAGTAKRYREVAAIDPDVLGNPQSVKTVVDR